MSEPIFAAHQIKVPADLPEILKNFSKHIIRTQPQNIIEAYFTDLQDKFVKVKADPNASLIAFYSRCSEQDGQNVTRLYVDELCRELNVDMSAIQDIFDLLEATDEIKWIHFWTFLIANYSHSVEDTLKTAFTAMSVNDTAPSSVFCEIVTLLTEKDDSTGLPVEHILSEIRNSGDRFELSTLEAAMRVVVVPQVVAEE